MLINAVVALVFLVWPWILKLLFPEVPSSSELSFMVCGLGFLAYLSALLLKNIQMRFLVLIWVFWFFLGSLNTVASGLVYGVHYAQLDLNYPSVIHFLYCIGFSGGVFAFERSGLSFKKLLDAGGDAQSKNYNLSLSYITVFEWVLLLFPLLWILSIYLSVGYIPLFAGYDITDDMYETRYGPLYPYTIIMAFSATYFAALVARNQLNLAFYAIPFFIVMISMADGKRLVAMIVMMGLISILRRDYRLNLRKVFLLIILSVLVLYIAGMFLREGADVGRYIEDDYRKFMLVGVEFRDYVYSFSFLNPFDVPGYSWLASSLGAFFNSSLLAIFGFDKNELVAMGSAYVWSTIFSSDFGIRTGFISELWFAYGFLGILVMASFSFLLAWSLHYLASRESIFSAALGATVYGFSVMQIVGQTTTFAGSLTILLYLYVIYFSEKYVWQK